MSESAVPKWKHDGVRIIPGSALDPNTAQTPGMERKAAIDRARAGAQKIWAGVPMPGQGRITMARWRA
jgi:uncharacterized RmlC-like cupin family protein